MPRPWRGVLFVGRAFRHGAVQEMKVWPFGAALRWEASNHHMLHRVVVAVQSHVRGGDLPLRQRAGGRLSKYLDVLRYACPRPCFSLYTILAGGIGRSQFFGSTACVTRRELPVLATGEYYAPCGSPDTSFGSRRLAIP
ncbi:MAG: hypothetical protein QOG75_4437, partial [Mycobacterium sp.]|nr:hypothetical protein [Mycobacterium sp.]